MDKDSVISMRNRTVRLDREGDYWTDDEREQLKKSFYEGVGITQMSQKFQRTEPAIIQQIEKLNLYKRKEAPSRRKTSHKEPACLCSFCSVDPALCPMAEHCPKLKEDK